MVRKVDLDMMQIFPRQTSRSGFTLIEVMLVIGIMAVLVAFGLPRMIKKEGNIKDVARKFMVMGKEVRNKAKLFQSTYRLVIRMNGEEHTYWVEKAPGSQLLASEDEKEKLEKMKSENPEYKDPFQIDKTILKEPTPLPRGIYFGQVENSSSPEPTNDGDAYIHFFPEGNMERSAIQLTNRKNTTWTLVFNPITGHAEIFEEAKTIKEALQ